MGSPLSHVLANIFMIFYESKRLNEYNLNKPKFYLIYIDILAAFDNEQDSLCFFGFSDNRHPNIKSMIDKQINHSITFFDVFISGINMFEVWDFDYCQNLTLQTYRKSTYTGMSFTSFFCKIRLIKCLIDKSVKICNNWNSFHSDIKNIKFNLIKSTYLSLFVKVFKKYLNHKFSSNQNQLKTNLIFITLNNNILANFHTVSKINFQDFAKSFVKKILTLS